MQRRHFLLSLLLFAGRNACAEVAYPQVERGVPLRFPRDHGSHPMFRTEWWYVTGIVDSPGAEVGVQTHLLVKLRAELLPMKEKPQTPPEFVEWHAFSLCRLQNTRDRAGNAPVGVDFTGEMFAAGAGEPVIARAAIPGGPAPLTGDPALDQHALQRGIERALLDLEDVFGSLLDCVRYFKTVHFTATQQGLEDHHVERARRNGLAIPCHIDSLCQGSAAVKGVNIPERSSDSLKN